jgi:cytidyltransferase-like protein
MSDKEAIVSGVFDQINSSNVRFLETAASFGALHVLLWSDELAIKLGGERPKYPQEERIYLLNSIRYVSQVRLVNEIHKPNPAPERSGFNPQVWIEMEDDFSAHTQLYCEEKGIKYRIIRQSELEGFPPLLSGDEVDPARKRVLVTGSFDWLHSGHVRFFEETSALGDLYVVVGHDANICLLKGDGHPLYPQDERAYMVQSIRFVKRALISSGHGWMDGEPEIKRIKPHIYAVNQDGDKPEKRKFCAQHGIEYLVLERKPKQGLPRRESTLLRGY